MNYLTKIATLTLSTVTLICSCSKNLSTEQPQDTKYEGVPLELDDHYEVTPLADRIVALGTLSDIDEEAALKAMEGTEIKSVFGCSAACKVTSSGKLIFGRNMDLSCSEYPVYIFKTAYGKYKTLNFAYDFSYSYEDILSGTKISEENLNMMPYMSTDVMNETGFYIEADMREDQNDAQGKSQFASSGTNPGKQRVVQMSLCQYLGCRCRTVGEALDTLKNIDVYSLSGKVNWPLTFLMGDAEGRYGLLEIAGNKISFLEGQGIQTNFYITPELKEISKYPLGLGRYAVLEEGLSAVDSELDIHNLLSKVYCSHLYNDILVGQPYFHFDIRSEFCKMIPLNDEGEVDYVNGKKENCTIDWVMNPDHAEVLEAEMENIARLFLVQMTESQRRASMIYSISVEHYVVNCTDKTITAQLWENPYMTYTFKW